MRAVLLIAIAWLIVAPAVPAQVRGRVVDADGRPLAGVDVSAHPRGASHVTGPSGGFELARATAWLELTAAGHATTRVPTAGRQDLGDVVLLTGAPLVGRVVDTSGAPVPGVEVTASDDFAGRPFFDDGGDADAPVCIASGVTGADGGFRIDGALPVGVRVTVEPGPGLRYAVAPVRAGLPVEVVVDVLRDVRGEVVDGHGAPVPDATVFVADGGAWVVQATTGAAGDFRAVVPERVGLTVAAFVHDAGLRASCAPVALPAGGPVDRLRLLLDAGGGGLLEVRAVDATTGAPIDAFRVGHVVGDPESLGLVAVDVADALATRPRRAEHGAVTVPRPDPGASVVAELRAPGRGRRRIAVRGDLESIAVPLGPESVVHGRVFDARHGAAIAGARIGVVPAGTPWTDGVMPPTECRTAPDGAFVLRELSPGRWRILVATEGATPVADCVVAVPPGRSIENVIVPVHDVERLVGRLAGVAAGAGWELRILRDPLGQRTEPFAARAAVAADGRFEFSGVRSGPGRLVLVLPQPERLGPSRPIDLGALAFDGRPLEIDLGAVLRPVRGQLRITGSPPPRGRFAVFVEPEVPPPLRDRSELRLEGARTTVGVDGSFELLTEVGEQTMLVVDLATGVVFERVDHFVVDRGAAPHDLGLVDVPCVRAIVRFSGEPPVARDRRIEIDLGPLFPWGVGRIAAGAVLIRGTAHGVGVDVAAGARELELFLPACETRLTLTGRLPGEVGPKALASTVVDPGSRTTMDVDLAAGR